MTGALIALGILMDAHSDSELSRVDETFSLPSARRRTLPPALATRYEDVTFVGEGGMGTVYRGRDPRLGRSVALKLIKNDDPGLWQRFIQEAKSRPIKTISLERTSMLPLRKSTHCAPIGLSHPRKTQALTLSWDSL